MLRAVGWGILASFGVVMSATAADDGESVRFFENSVRPVLAERCVECHGKSEQSGGLRLDSLASILAGGDSGPAVVVGRPDESLLVQAIRHAGDLEMPPENKLPEVQVAALTEWVRQGAFWPSDNAKIRSSIEEAKENHWAFQPIRDPQPPVLADDSWVRTPIDAFVRARLNAAGLSPSPEADRRTLIRRATYSLTGLPPSMSDVEQFVQDSDASAYDRLVDRLLESPQYGEHWARHWLDVARYSDTKGYVYGREERFWVHAWSYRDWVVRALNEDMPYGRFLLLQIAADQVEDRRVDDLAAMGFLTLGRRFLGVERDIIDDRIDVVTRGTMGLTVGCARCHDHKYDPIPTADYYSLYGVFDSCREEIVRLDETPTGEEFEAELQKRRKVLADKMAEAHAEWSDRVRSRIGDYLTTQTELSKYPPKGFDQVFEKTDIIPAFVRRWESYLRNAKRTGDPVFVHWHAYMDLPAESFAEQAPDVTRQLQAASDRINPLVAAAFTEPPTSFAEVIERYAALLTDVDTRWKAVLASAEGSPPSGFETPADEQLRQVMYGAEAPCEVPHESVVHTESFYDSARCTELWKLHGDVERWIIQSQPGVAHAVTLVDRPVASEPRIFLRGNPATKGEEVPRQFLSLISGSDASAFTVGSGRRELAEAIIDPANPLTARVIVNRVWAHHFGTGLVPTPSDFGTRAGLPSHPELLDWLATWFTNQNGSLKALHRLILKSAVYRQGSFGPADPQMIAKSLEQDPENRLLWRMNSRRLSFEEFRDSLLVAAGEIDLTAGGKPADLFQAPYPKRRTLYGLVDRQFFPNTLRAFDFANPDLHIPKRPETIVPQQALFLMNHPFVLQQAKSLANEIDGDAPLEQRVAELFRRCLQREPTETQVREAAQFVQAAGHDDVAKISPTAKDWQYGHGVYDEAAQRVPEFSPLPHFTGQAWQGGPQWPDAALGWVQLTASGGHPGNDRAHASIRRWTAPRAMTIQVASTLTHEPAAGDGIRAFVVSSRAGLLATANVHQQSADLDAAAFAVEQGETVDFVVDIGDVLNSDQYLWDVTVSETASGTEPVTWNSNADFTRDVATQLTPWEQLAHVLLCANEFTFVD